MRTFIEAVFFLVVAAATPIICYMVFGAAKSGDGRMAIGGAGVAIFMVALLRGLNLMAEWRKRRNKEQRRQ
jgi:hypothetical protein